VVERQDCRLGAERFGRAGWRCCRLTPTCRMAIRCWRGKDDELRDFEATVRDAAFRVCRSLIQKYETNVSASRMLTSDTRCGYA
jgi:hypothetical protein